MITRGSLLYARYIQHVLESPYKSPGTSLGMICDEHMVCLDEKLVLPQWAQQGFVEEQKMSMRMIYVLSSRGPGWVYAKTVFDSFDGSMFELKSW